MRRLASLSLFVAACAGPAPAVDAGLGDAGPRACRTGAQCPEGSRCAVDGVAEVALEDGDEGVCTRADALIGGAPAELVVRPGGTALADRLCLAQGISPGRDLDALRARQLELVAATGVHLLRLDLRWATIEPERGVLDFSAVDPMIHAADSAGIEVLGVLGYGVPWATEATDSDTFHPPDDPADFAAFAREVAARYAGRIRRYEIWNEPNAGYRFWRPTTHGDAAAFAELQALAAAAVHEACADCVVYSAGLFFQEQLINGAVEFTHDMLQARPDALSGVDVFSLHPYPLYPPQDPPEVDGPSRSFAGMDADLRAVLARGGVERPFAVTELGWPVYGAVDEDAQARLLSRAMLLGAALGWDPMCWFNVTDGPMHGSFPPEDDFGLYRYGAEDPSATIEPKPARDALAWLASIGEGAIFAGVDEALHDPDAGRYALAFDAPGGRWTAAWSLEPSTVTIAEPHAVRDHLGADAGVTPASIELGPAPLFLLP